MQNFYLPKLVNLTILLMACIAPTFLLIVEVLAEGRVSDLPTEVQILAPVKGMLQSLHHTIITEISE